MTRLYIVPLLLPLSLFPSQVVVTVLFLLWARSDRMREVKVCAIKGRDRGGRHMAREIALFLEGKCILPRARCQIWEDNVSEDVC